MKPIKLALNAGSLLLPHTGIASYTRNLAAALRESGEVEPCFFYGLGWSTEIRDAGVPGVNRIRETLLKLLPRPRGLMARLGVQRRCFAKGVRQYSFDIYHEPGFLPFPFPGPTVISVHDLSPLRHPETHPADRVRTIKEQLPRAVTGATAIVVDSEFVKREVIEMFRADPARVHAIHLGVSPDYRPRPGIEASVCLARYGLAFGEYALAVGTLEPRKNLVQAIDAHSGLPEAARKRTPLVIAGLKGWLTRDLDARIRSAEEKGEVRWLGYVPAEHLPLLYAGARLFVYPSFYEGFGLPVLEAMASGVPVITSNQASLPEVAGNAAIMIDPHDREALRDSMLRLIEDEREAQRLAALGLAQAARFTWRACAEKTLAVYRRAMGGSNG